jgi:hypothetical protein
LVSAPESRYRGACPHLLCSSHISRQFLKPPSMCICGTLAYRLQKDHSKRWLVQKLRLLHLEFFGRKNAEKRLKMWCQTMAQKFWCNTSQYSRFGNIKKSVFPGLNLLY